MADSEELSVLNLARWAKRLGIGSLYKKAAK